MLKKIISLLVIFAMLVPLSSAVAADEPTSQPTIEEILNGYHKKAFAAQHEEETNAASTWSRSSSSEKTLEQETVEELTAAGYEAYNVTTDNYDSLEASLQTDFSQLGLDSDSSYIVVISGEERSESSDTSNKSRVADFPSYDYGDESAGASTFLYTYNNTTYTMRYLIVAAADNSNYAKSDSYDLLSNKGIDLINACLNTMIYAALDKYTKKPVGTVLSILGINLIDLNPEHNTEITYYGGTNWTRRFLQVCDDSGDAWYTRVSTEYVTIDSIIFIYYYNSELDSYTGHVSEKINTRTYTTHYYDYEWMKEQAVLSHVINSTYYEYTGAARHYYGEKLLFVHYEYYAP